VSDKRSEKSSNRCLVSGLVRDFSSSFAGDRLCCAPQNDMNFKIPKRIKKTPPNSGGEECVNFS
jgi:hypothetical protein